MFSREQLQKFYNSSSWKSLRNQKKSIDCFCSICLEKGIYQPTEEIHHILGVQERPDLALTLTNLKSLCKSCHSQITMTEEKQKKKGKGSILNIKYKL